MGRFRGREVGLTGVAYAPCMHELGRFETVVAQGEVCSGLSVVGACVICAGCLASVVYIPCPVGSSGQDTQRPGSVGRVCRRL